MKSLDSHDRINTLVVHPGGLGDVCLSESLFFSLQQHFGGSLIACGNMRFLKLFSGYFQEIENIESRKWTPVFADEFPIDIEWEQVVLVGKDREKTLIQRWQKLSRRKVIFIDMYPDKLPAGKLSPGRCNPDGGEPAIHVEAYQLRQLAGRGMKTLKREIALNCSPRIILYPEKGYKKEKWPPERFLSLAERLRSTGRDAVLLGSLDFVQDTPGMVFLENLEDVKKFLSHGGIFVSNDSGMAHLAGVLGLYTITIFFGTDPLIWRPRGYGEVLRNPAGLVSEDEIMARIGDALNTIVFVPSRC